MPDNHNEELDTYTIPPNFMENGTLFGGAFKLRNALEAGAIVLAVGLPRRLRLYGAHRIRT